ncbi:MAG: choice-of-anchor D domain-containing protein, partial [bacterium]|nr:choice-of-anchor D domain-containing protein [Candidatus Kapabacteria bacterium]
RQVNADLSQFGLGTGGVSIPVGICSSSPAAVHFAPTSQGLKTAALVVTVVGSPVRRLVVLRGRGIQGEISVMSKPALDTMVCGMTARDSILVRNVGTGPLTIKEIRHIDSPGGLLQPVGLGLPQVIVPGGSLSIKIEATAYITGSFESTLEIVSDDLAHTPMTVKMRFFRRRFAMALSTDALTLPAAQLGERTAQACIEYSNRGDAAQIINSIDAIGGDNNIRHISPSLPVSVAAGGSVRICFDAMVSDTGSFSRQFALRTSPCSRDTNITVRVQGRSAIVRSDTVVAMPAIVCERASRSVIPISNDGNDTLVLRQPDIGGSDASGVTIISPATWPLRIAPNSTDAITVELEPITASTSLSSTLTFETNDRTPGKSPWTIRIETTRSSAIARPTVSTIDVGSICIGDSRVITLHVESVGNAEAHVVSAKLLETGTTAASISALPTGAVLAPGSRDSIVLRFAPTTRGSFSSLVEIRSGPCGRTDTVSITGTGSEVDLASSDAGALGTFLSDRPSTAKVTVRNDGNAPATIIEASTRLGSRVTVANQLPFTIAAGGSVDLTLTVNTDATGPIAERIHVVSSSDCVDSLDLNVRGIVVDAGGASLIVHTREIRFTQLFKCEDVCKDIELESVGERPVRIESMRIEGATNAFQFDAPVSTPEINPGERLTLPVCYKPLTDDDISDAELVLKTSDSAMSEVRIPLHASSMKGLSTDASLSFGIVPDNVARDTSITITNPSSRPLEITWTRIPAPFSVETTMPQTVPPNGTLTILLRAQGIEAYERTRLVMGTSHPCGDSLVVTVDALSDDRFVVIASADTSVGRWGQSITVPIRYTDTTRARVTEVELVVMASAKLLDPRNVAAAPGLVVEREGFDVATGALTLRIHREDGLPVESHDELVVIQYDVLRGDAIATSITPVVIGLRPGIASQTNPGAFMLEDYCDAHSRLLRMTGSIALLQNAPNPAKTRTVFEFETSFDDHVVIAIYDLRGNEVHRVIDEWMPAGRRRVEFGVDILPAGAYTYRLFTGLQSLTRRLVVTP